MRCFIPSSICCKEVFKFRFRIRAYSIIGKRNLNCFLSRVVLTLVNMRTKLLFYYFITEGWYHHCWWLRMFSRLTFASLSLLHLNIISESHLVCSFHHGFNVNKIVGRDVLDVFQFELFERTPLLENFFNSLTQLKFGFHWENAFWYADEKMH